MKNVRSEAIPVSGPSISQKEIEYVMDAAANAWYQNAGTYVRKFEQAFSKYIGTEFAIALPSCTSAIHLSLLALGIGPGDEVIVPDITWIATAAPIQYVGATPVFADIDKESWCLSADSFEQRITKNTKAVILVDLYGNVPDMDRIREIADKHGIYIIEDAAEAIGSEYKGQKAGSFGHAGVFSFHGSKTMTTGEGGMLVTNDQGILEKALFYRDHGRKPGDRSFYNREVAYKYKMSDLQAALGLAQLERITELVDRKRQIYDWYGQGLRKVPGINLNVVRPDVKSTYWMVTIITDPGLNLPKEVFMEKLSANGIDSRPFFYPLSSLPAYENLERIDKYRKENIISYGLSPYGTNLPSGLNLTRQDVEYVCQMIEKILLGENT